MMVAGVTAIMEGLLVVLHVKKIMENITANIVSRTYLFLALSFAASALRFASSVLSFSISTNV
jgi:hypothetical protein